MGQEGHEAERQEILTGFEAFNKCTPFGRIHESRTEASGEVDVGHLGSGSNVLIDPSEVGPHHGVHHGTEFHGRASRSI